MSLWRRAGIIRRYLVSRIRAFIAAESERLDLVANLDTARRSLADLKAENERLLCRVGINAIADQTIALQEAHAEIERLTKANADLRFENIQMLTAAVEGRAS